MKRSLKRIADDYRRHPWIHLISIITLSLALFILGGFFLLSRNVQRIAEAPGAETSGTISGHIRWQGPDLDLKPQVGVVPNGTAVYRWIAVTNPFAPRVDPTNHGLSNALIYLKKVAPARSKPWDWPPLRVEHRDFQLQLIQGDKAQIVAVVRTGADVQTISYSPLGTAFSSNRPSPCVIAAYGCSVTSTSAASQ